MSVLSKDRLVESKGSDGPSHLSGISGGTGETLLP